MFQEMPEVNAQGGGALNPGNQGMLQMLWARSQGDTGPAAQGPVVPTQGGGGPPPMPGPPGHGPGGPPGGSGGLPPWPPFPFGYPPHGGQGHYPGLQGPGGWNSNWPPGAGQFGWKLDVEKEIPYFPLVYSGAHERQKVVCTPLRVSKRYANSMLWTIYNVQNSATMWVAMKPDGWKKGRNRRECETLARVLDLMMTEFGHDTCEKSAAMEVMLRRMHAIYTADMDGHWEQAVLLEEVPTGRHPHLHEVIIKDMVNTALLMQKSREVKPGRPTEDDDD